MKKSKTIIFTALLLVVIFFIINWIAKGIEGDTPDVEAYVKFQYNKQTRKELGLYTTSTTDYLDIGKDTLMFKSIVGNFETRVIADGIAIKTDTGWQYSNFKLKTFKRNENIDSLRKYFLDGSLVSHE